MVSHVSRCFDYIFWCQFQYALLFVSTRTCSCRVLAPARSEGIRATQANSESYQERGCCDFRQPDFITVRCLSQQSRPMLPSLSTINPSNTARNCCTLIRSCLAPQNLGTVVKRLSSWFLKASKHYIPRRCYERMDMLVFSIATISPETM